MKKFLALLLTFTLVFSASTIPVFAEDAVDEITDDILYIDDEESVLVQESADSDVNAELYTSEAGTDPAGSSEQSDSADLSVSVENTASVPYVNATECAISPAKNTADSASALVKTNEVMPSMSVGFTVDFVYDDLLYSIDGESDVLLSELFAVFNITATIDTVFDVEFTNYDYLDIIFEGSDWRITSLCAFISEEILTVTFTDGSIIEIYVYDSSPIVAEPTGNYCILYYTTQKDSLGNDVPGIYWYSNTAAAYIPVPYWGAPNGNIEYICTTIEQALEWVSINAALNGFGVSVTGARIYIMEMYHVPAGGEIWGQDYLSAHWPGIPFLSTQILRAPGYEGEMIHIYTDFNKHLYVQNNVVIDNASAHCPNVENPVCIRVADGGLMIADGCIIMDTTIASDPVNKTGYKGTGVLLTTMDEADKVYPMVELNGGALELIGNTQIHHFAIAVDSDYGVTRLREPNPTLGTWNIDNNVLSVNLAYGTYLGKWCDNINQINNVSVYLEEVERWKSGDIILGSGYKSNPDVTQPDIKTPVVPTDRNKIVIQNNLDLQYSMAVNYYGGITSDPYPVIRFEIASVYNIQLAKWYFTLYEAVAESRANDTLVFYDSTNEGYTVSIPHNLTIRSSYVGEKPGGIADVRAGSDCSATWNGNIFVNAVLVGSSKNATNGMTVYFGSNDTANDYGNLTFDTNYKCRHIENFGTAYLYDNFTLTRGNCEYGGSICSVGFTYLDGAEILNSTATLAGDGGAVAISQGAFYFKSGKIDNCIAGDGGAFFVNIGGTLDISGGTISNCTGTYGGAVYQHGVFYLGGKVSFTGNRAEDIYLPSYTTMDTATGSYVITKSAEFDFGTAPVTVTLGVADENYYDGRNVVISGNAAVLKSDLTKFDLTNLANYNKDIFETFAFVYTGSDITPGNVGKSVLELDITLLIKLGDLTITKTVKGTAKNIDPEQAFVFDVAGNDANTSGFSMTVIVYGNGSVTIKDLPVGSYKVTERTDWSWRYGSTSVTVSVNGGTAVKAVTATASVLRDTTTTVAYTNTLTNKYWFSDTTYAVNKFNEV